MDLDVGEIGFIFNGEHPLLVTRTQVSDPGPMGPLVFFARYIWYPTYITHLMGSEHIRVW